MEGFETTSINHFHLFTGPMKKTTLRAFLRLFFILLVMIPLSLGFIFPNTSKLILCLITHTLPDAEHLTRIRKDLESQTSFITMLAKHETSALNRFKKTENALFTRKYIHRTRTSMFDLHSFHDDWEVWVRTDIVKGRPLTSYLIRLGFIKDTNAESFFSDQCHNRFCKTVLRSSVAAYNKLFDWGIVKPIRLNITESDATSSVGRQRVELKAWHEKVQKIHGQGTGLSFIQIAETGR